MKRLESYMNKVFFHVGYHKTGTTWMQNELFPKLNIKYLGRIYNSKKNADHNFSGKGLGEIISLAKKQTEDVLISDEGIMTDQSPKQVAQQIKRHFAGAKIILSIRNQNDLINSRINHASKRFYLQKKLAYECKSENINGEAFEFYDFENTFNIFSKYFGSDAVHIIVYERLFDDDLEILRLEKFLNTKLNGLTSKDIKYNKRSKNKQIKNSLNKKIKERYRESNYKISKKLNINLNKYGY